MSITIALDWAHKEGKKAVYDGVKVTRKLPKLSKGDRVLVENIPAKLARELFKTGADVFRVHPNDIAEWREANGIVKSDEADAVCIWDYYAVAPERFNIWHGDPPLISLYRGFKELQKERVKFDQRIWAKEESSVLTEVQKHLAKAENRIKEEIEEELKELPIWTEWLGQLSWSHEYEYHKNNPKKDNELKVKNHSFPISPAAGILGYVQKIGIGRFDTASSLRHYAGLHPVKIAEDDNGHPIHGAARRKKGHTTRYNTKLKTICMGHLGTDIVRSYIPVYNDVYKQEKERRLAMKFPPGHLASRPGCCGYKEKETEYKRGHADFMARRKAVQVFLVHLWLIWRVLEGHSIRPPYPLEKQNHHTFIWPPACPEVARKAIEEVLEN